MDEYARLSSIHYIYNKDQRKGMRRANRMGWDIDKGLSNKDVITYKKGEQVHLNYAGTNILNPRDLVSDAMLATGAKSADFTDRKRRTRDIMRKLGDDKQYSLSGHSLGGSIALNTIKESKSIRDRIKEVHVYNPGLTAPFAKTLKADRADKKELNQKVTIHRVKGDIVSEGMKPNFGKEKTYEVDGNLLEKHTIDAFTGE